MDNLKQLWEKLAKENSRYYINSDMGKKITEDEFKESGKNDCQKYIFEDENIYNNFEINNSVILEIGCGTGRMTEFLAKSFKQVIATDISAEMINQAIVRTLSPNIQYVVTDGILAPAMKESVDIAFSYIVFQHMKDREMVEANFKEVYRVLREGGLFKVLLRTDKVDLKKWWGGVNYSEKSATIMSHNMGFSVIKTEKVNNYGIWLWLKKY